MIHFEVTYNAFLRRSSTATLQEQAESRAFRCSELSEIAKRRLIQYVLVLPHDPARPPGEYLLENCEPGYKGLS